MSPLEMFDRIVLDDARLDGRSMGGRKFSQVNRAPIAPSSIKTRNKVTPRKPPICPFKNEYNSCVLTSQRSIH